MKGDSPDSDPPVEKDSKAEKQELENENPAIEDSREGDSPDEISLPDPNIQDGDGSATYGNETSMARRVKEWGVEYEHPLDRFHATPKSGGPGCLSRLSLAIALFALGLVLVGVVFGWATTGRFVQQGYEVVRLSEKETVITRSPKVPTCYLGRSIDIRIPKCRQPIAVIGTRVTVRGDFLSDVSLTAIRLHATEQARFAKDLEIYAGDFRDESATLLGIRKGIVLRELIPSEDPEPTTP